jgi:uncharacterized membrane protein
MTAGGLFAVHVALIPTMRALTDSAAVRLHQVFDEFVHRYMPTTTISAVVLVIILLAGWSLSTETVILLAAGLAGTVVTILVSQFLNVPINRIVRRWDPRHVPADYHTLRRRWSGYNAVRTVAAVGALASYTAACLAI